MSSPAECERCGKPLTRGKRGPAPRYCSAVCRARVCDEKAKADGRYSQWQRNGYARRKAAAEIEQLDQESRDFGPMRPGSVDPAGVVDDARRLLSYTAAGWGWQARDAFKARLADAGATELRRIAEQHLPGTAARLALERLDEAGL